MLNIFLDGLAVFWTYKVGIFIFLIAVFGFGFFTIKSVTNGGMNTGIELLAAISVGIIPLCVISYALILLTRLWHSFLWLGSLAILFIAILILLKGFWSGEIKIPSDARVLFWATPFFLLLLIRLAYLKHVLLPPYSDSPIHYQIVKGFLQPDASSDSRLSLESLFSNYYHFGFHSLVAWLATIANLEPGNTISLLGQLFLVIACVSVVFLNYTMTGDSSGAWFAGLLAAIGWSMPAFAVNWGKFPAIGSLAVLPAIAAILLSWRRGNFSSPVHCLWGFVLVAGITLLHTRALICVLLIGTCIFIAAKLPIGERFGLFQSVRYAVLYIVSLWPLKPYLLDYYSGWPVIVIFCVLLPFAFREFPRLALGIFVFTAGLWLIVIVPPLFGDDYRVLFDQQFLEMMMYIPFSIMGGLGLSGIVKSLPLTRVQWLAAAVLPGIVILNFFRHPALYPDPCCDYFKKDDQHAFEWLQGQVGEHGLVLISSFDNRGQVLGTDAGIWIYPLLGLPTNKLRFDTDWASQVERETVCNFGAEEVYIYAGDRIFSFNNVQLAQEPWVEEVYEAGHTIIYRVSSCSE
jgi:hypothetical protein